MTKRRGFTLVEALIAIVVMGLVMAIVFPRFRNTLAKQSVRGSRTTLIGLYAKARLIAMQQGRTAELRFNGNQVFITARPPVVAGNIYDTVIAPHNLQTEFGVTLTAAPNPVSIDPKGYASAAVLTTAKSPYADTVQISQYGRVLK